MNLKDLLPKSGPAHHLSAEIDYYSGRDPHIFRFIDNKVELNSGTFSPYRVNVVDCRPEPDSFTLGKTGFELFRSASAVQDFGDRNSVETVYHPEVAKLIQDVTGAEKVHIINSVVRAAWEKEGAFPPAGNVHVDFDGSTAMQLAISTFPDAEASIRAGRRFAFYNVWRMLTPSPADQPLAVCDARSVDPQEGIKSYFVFVDSVPENYRSPEAWPTDLEDRWKSSIFRFNPEHRWHYYSAMTPEEALAFTIYDSGSEQAARTPHTAFIDRQSSNVVPRSSIEVRTIALF